MLLGSASLLWPAVGMALFGALLGTDRRWWPWALAPVAVLLSFAPATAALVGPEGLQDWSLFGAVLPLFLVGLVASAWHLLAARATHEIIRAMTAMLWPRSRGPYPVGAVRRSCSTPSRPLCSACR